MATPASTQASSQTVSASRCASPLCAEARIEVSPRASKARSIRDFSSVHSWEGCASSSSGANLSCAACRALRRTSSSSALSAIRHSIACASSHQRKSMALLIPRQRECCTRPDRHADSSTLEAILEGFRETVKRFSWNRCHGASRIRIPVRVSCGLESMLK